MRRAQFLWPSCSMDLLSDKAIPGALKEHFQNPPEKEGWWLWVCFHVGVCDKHSVSSVKKMVQIETRMAEHR